MNLSKLAIWICALSTLATNPALAGKDSWGVPNTDFDPKIPASSVPIAKPAGLGAAPTARCLRWDYNDYPTKITSTTTPPGRYARYAMDGYPASTANPFPRDFWYTDTPTSEKPETLTVDYQRPVAVTRFAHYYDHFRNACAWKNVDILSSTDGENFTLLNSFTNLPEDYPQTMPIDKPAPARYYRFVIKSLGPSAQSINTFEIETFYGTSIGAADCAKAVQSESTTLNVRIASPDIDLKGATIKLVGPAGAFAVAPTAAIPAIAKGDTAVVAVKIMPLISGPIPVRIELRVGGNLADSRIHNMTVEPKLQLDDVTPSGGLQLAAGSDVTLKGKVTNGGSSASKSIQVAWMGKTVKLGDIAPGKSTDFEIKIKAKPGYANGAVVATDAGLGREVIRRPIVCASADKTAVGGSKFAAKADNLSLSVPVSGAKKALTGGLAIYHGDKKCPLAIVAPDRLAAVVPGAVFVAKVIQQGSQDLKVKCSIIPNDPNPMHVAWLDLKLRLAVDDPKVMFRPHVDWYTVEHGPNLGGLANGHNTACRMICVQTKDSTLSIVPSTDNMAYGFNEKNEMELAFQLPLAPFDPLKTGEWRQVGKAPLQFELTLPARNGDWWDAYRYVTEKIYKFEQPRQWAMSVTEMQMHNARYLMNYASWSEKWQSTRSFPYQDTFFNFYGTTYSLPALYSWYLATGNLDAKMKTDKVLDWLLKLQETEGPHAGGWFSQYASTGDKLVGYDQAGNRWIMPHATGTAAKTLLWYWEANGKSDSKVFQAAKKACDYLVAQQRADGGWPYAYFLDGKPVTDLPDAGQIWCTWALWKMWQFSGEEKYKTAAIASKDFFKKTFMDIHRYMGYWEDVSGGAGNVTRSFESYEPAIGVLVFTDMGEPELAMHCAKDTATWTWSRVISTRQYETCYGETTEQSTMGPAQAQVPMVAVAFHQTYSATGDKLWSDLAGAMKAINFCAEPELGYGMCATSGWFDPTTAVSGPPYDNIRSWITPNNGREGEYGRGPWIEWQTSQFAWLALEWLVREGNVRAPEYVNINPLTLQGKVLGEPGRVRMPEEKCDVHGVEHYDINWVGYRNDEKYSLLVMNHKEKVNVMIRPHEAHLEIYTRTPQILIGSGKNFKPVQVVKKGVNYVVEIPANENAILVWDRIK